MTIDLPSRLSALSRFGAGWVLWLLIALSVVALAVALERALALALARRDSDACGDELRALLRRGDLDAARARAVRSSSIEGRLVAAGLAAWPEAANAASAEQRM